MAKFMNVVTGNVLTVTNPDTIKLMERSDRYKAVAEKRKKNQDDQKAQEDAKQQPAE